MTKRERRIKAKLIVARAEIASLRMKVDELSIKKATAKKVAAKVAVKKVVKKVAKKSTARRKTA